MGHSGGCGQRPNTLLLQNPQHIHTPMPFSLRRSTLPALPGRADLLLVLLLSSWGREGTMAARTSSRLSEGEDRLSKWPRLPSFQYSPGTSTLQGGPVSMLPTEEEVEAGRGPPYLAHEGRNHSVEGGPFVSEALLPGAQGSEVLWGRGGGRACGEGKKQVSRARPQCRGHSWFQPAPSLPTHTQDMERPLPRGLC